MSRRRFPGPFRSRCGRLELVYVPVYVVNACVDGTSRGVLFVVDAIAGTVQRLDRSVDLAASAEPPTGEFFPARIDASEAIERARTEIPWIALPVALKQNRRFDVSGLDVLDCVGYPYWIQHLVRRRGYDIRVIDGLTVGRVGSRVRAAILEAMVPRSPRRGAALPPAGTERHEAGARADRERDREYRDLP